jgi:hypothetical protein
MRPLMPSLVGLGFVFGCSDTVVVGGLEEVASIKAIPNRDIDLLFVVDDSGSMAGSQSNLAASFPRMIDVLSTLEGGLPNLHIGVVTSDMGTSALAGAPAPPVGTVGVGGGCDGAGRNGALMAFDPSLTVTFISDIGLPDGTRERNYQGELRDVFAANATGVGINGCGFEQHLLAMQASLGNPANAGFFRPEANLAVVIIADEDDCSAADSSFFSAGLLDEGSFACTKHGITCDQPVDSLGEKTNCVASSDSLIADVQQFGETLVAFKGDPRKVMTATIGGPATSLTVIPGTGPFSDSFFIEPSCSYSVPGQNFDSEAVAGFRLAEFANLFPGRSTFTSICDPELAAPLQQIGGTAKRLVGDPCLDTTALVDASPDPGVQPVCEVVDTRDSNPGAPTVLPPCAETTGDCYEVLADPVACPFSEDHLRLQLRRAEVTDDLWTSVRCQVR